MKQLAIKAAKEAGRILLNNLGKVRAVKEKSLSNFVTNVDLAAEKKIFSVIRKKYPSFSILSEEAGFIDKNSDYKWVIDPLDGTHNYMHSLPIFGTSIALEYKDEVKLGVIYLPMLNQLFVAEKGKGAFLNGKRIKVSGIKELKDSLLLFEGSLHLHWEEKRKFLDKVNNKVFRVRISGAACFDLISLAQGSCDLHIGFATNPWDVAAGFLLIREAGGKITDFNGNAVDHYCRSFVASNSKLHNKILELIKS